MAKPTDAEKENLAEAIRRRFAEFGGVELELPKRDAIRPPPNFSEDRPRPPSKRTRTSRNDS
jgi:hypothetical protein